MLQRRTPLKAKAGIKPKKVGRVKDRARVRHGRIKPKFTEPTSEQERYWSSLPDSCEACGTTGTVVHHLMSAVPGKEHRRDHWFVIRLCPQHHNMGNVSVHLLGSEAAFKERTGVDLVAASVRNLIDWKAEHE